MRIMLRRKTQQNARHLWLFSRFMSDLAAEAVAGHVAHCAACREVLGDLDGFSDPLIQGLRAAQSEPQLNPDDTRRAVERAIALDLALGARDAAGFLSPEPMRQRAIPVRCPHCRAHIELSTAEGIGAMTCGICGESFAVAAEEPLQEMAAGLSRRIAHFELIERAGEGGFGTVWKARDTRLGRTVALKIPHLGGNAAFEPLLHEARIAAGLAHPHIVAVLEVGCDGHPPYIASELIDGENLAAKLRGQPLTPREAAELVLRLAEALQVAHAAGVIHRDLKPENILIDQAGEPHISDFGLARVGSA